MKPEAIKEYFLVNGQLERTTNIEIFERIKKPPIYEVVRVIEGVPLFLEDHLGRMRESAEIVDYHIERKDEEIEEDIKKLIIKMELKI